MISSLRGPDLPREGHMAVHCGRREFITLIGGAAFAWPLTAHAQQPGRMRRIGVLMTLAAGDPIGQARVATFAQGLQQLGWTVGRNVQLDVRWPGAEADDVRRSAAELVAVAPDVIVANGNAPVAPLLQATRGVPIVFTIFPDPVGAGFVDSLPRPGGNATGFMGFEYNRSRARNRRACARCGPCAGRGAAHIREASRTGSRSVEAPIVRVRGSIQAPPTRRCRSTRRETCHDQEGPTD